MGCKLFVGDAVGRGLEVVRDDLVQCLLHTCLVGFRGAVLFTNESCFGKADAGLVEFLATAFGCRFLAGLMGGLAQRFLLALGVAESLAVCALGTVKFGQGSLVTAVPVTAVAVQEKERRVLRALRFAGFLDAGVAEGFAVGNRGVLVVGGVGAAGIVEFEEGGFGFVEATEGPAAVGDVAEGEVLAGGFGGENGAEFVAELVVCGRVFVLENGVALKGESVLEGVLAGGGLAFGGAGSGGVLGVGAVGGRACRSGIRRCGLRNEARFAVSAGVGLEIDGLCRHDGLLVWMKFRRGRRRCAPRSLVERLFEGRSKGFRVFASEGVCFQWEIKFEPV